MFLHPKFVILVLLENLNNEGLTNSKNRTTDQEKKMSMLGKKHPKQHLNLKDTPSRIIYKMNSSKSYSTLKAKTNYGRDQTKLRASMDFCTRIH